MKKVTIIGAGFSGMSAASFMAKAGWDVTVLEKHNMPGGRARKFEEQGFTFDMGPSWYWMPDVFERYFHCFGKKVSDYYELKRLDPSYRVYYPESVMDIPADYDSLRKLFESIEPGSANQLDIFMKEAAYKYKVGMNDLVYRPGLSIREFIDPAFIKALFKLDVFSSMKKHSRKYFKDPRLIELIEFPVLFLGALPEKIPALYSLMNYADIKSGTWYPQGGMYNIADAMYKLALELGVKFKFDHDIVEIKTEGNKVIELTADCKGSRLPIATDVVIAAADYHFIESKLKPEQRSYSEKYWDSRTMAPSCLLYYVGLNKKLKKISHHSLFFDVDFNKHGKEIYDDPQWPKAPLFYVCAPSVTDPTVAPAGSENLFFLIPVAAGLSGDTEALREQYFKMIVKRYEELTGEIISDAIIFKRSYAVSDFVHDYNAFKGNAYGLANTLMQTALLKPSIKSKKLKNLFYTGQLTVPGPGVPPSLISGEVVAKYVNAEM
ncbi:MAG: phytoene desaturase family protein [Ferruginibacter sp.]